LKTFRKNIVLKIALLLILSIKASVYVSDNYGSLEVSLEKTSIGDFEDSESEKKEVDEQKKIVEYLINNKSEILSSNKANSNYLQKIYASTYLEYSTPPPEFVI